MEAQRIDDKSIWVEIDDLIIKTIISVEPQIVSAVSMFVPHRQNCFEVLGFDILLDDTMHPWLLEVNFSPSLSTDSPLDHYVKSSMLAGQLFLDCSFEFLALF